MPLLSVGRASAARDFAPFLGTALLAWLLVPVGTTVDWPQYGLATVVLALAVSLRLLRPGWLSSRVGHTVPSLIFLAALGLLRNSAGGITSGVGAVAMVPVFFVALHGRGRRELFIVLAGMVAFYLAPLILVGPPAYPHSQYRTALVSVAVGWIVGAAVQHLVAGIRAQADTSRRREQMLDELREVMRSLYGSPEARTDVCRAAREIGGATCALIYEPIGGAGVMRSTAMAGLDAPPVEIGEDRRTAVQDALRTSEPVLLSGDVEAKVGSRELWRAAGSPESVLYEPLLRGSETLGVLVVGWPDEIRPGDPRLSTVKLLANEAASAIQQADMMDRLAAMAQTDALTGLPNRRAWDASVRQAVSEGRRFTVGMIDFDHFKEYNDRNGHPAGDRLLKETAAMWLHLLRTGDLLARLGGEEFGLLLLDCDTEHAVEVIERLRAATYGDQTCSAGFAERVGDERIESVMSRADEALYDAKSAGRDRACMSTAAPRMA